MHLTAKRQSRILVLLVGVLLFVASGVLAAAPHDHDPNEFCRVCSIGERVEAPVDTVSTDSPELEAATAPSLAASNDTTECLLLAISRRGPPFAS
jgi:hypothetical protein